MYKRAPKLQGMTVYIKTQRKGKNGKSKRASCGRNGKTGVIAHVYKAGQFLEKIPAPTFSALSTILRKRFKIHPNVLIAKYGKTDF